MKNDVWIKSRVSPELKERFRELAAREGRTESGQLKWLLQSAVASPEERVSTPASSGAESRDARMCVRLSGEDRRLLRERATARQMPSATYVSLLVRAHLIDQPPLPSQELATLKLLIAEISAIGRNLNQYVRAVQSGRRGDGFHVDDAKSLIKICLRVGEWTQGLIAKNAASWRTGERRD